MGKNDLRAAQLAFVQLRESLDQLEAVFKELVVGMAELDHRLGELERRKRKPSIHTFFDGSGGYRPPNFVERAAR